MEEEKKELEEEKVEAQEAEEEKVEEPKEEPKADDAKDEEPEIVKAFTDTKDDTKEFTKEDVEDNKIISLFAYIGILFLIPLLAAKQSRFARYHVNQGLVLFIFEIAITFPLYLLSLIPTVGIIFSITGYVFDALFVVLMVLGIVNSVQGKAKELPLIGKIKLIDYNDVEK